MSEVIAIEKLLDHHMAATRDQNARTSAEIHEIRAELRTLVNLSAEQTNILRRMSDLSDAVASHERRLQLVETDVPPLKEMRKWIVGAVATAVLALISVYGPRIVTHTQTQGAATPAAAQR